MKIKWHGTAPWGFPPVDPQAKDHRAKGVLFQPGQTVEVHKEWLKTWANVPQVASALKRGSYEGLEVVGEHEKALQSLYGDGKYQKDAMDEHLEILHARQRFLKNRTRTDLPVDVQKVVESPAFYR